MEIEPKGLPIHSDATLKIRPRIFLEGNWFVELQPGSPSAPTLSSGATIPITQTSDPVQLDQVLDALNTDTRANLQDFLQGYGDGLTRKPDAAENAEQDPDVYGLNGAQALNKTYHRAPRRRCVARRSSIRRSPAPKPARPLRADRGDRQNDRGAERVRAVARANGYPTSTPSSPSSPISPRASASRRRAAAGRAANAHRAFSAARRGLPADASPSPKRSPPASSRRVTPSPPRCRGSNRCRPRWRRTSSAASPRACSSRCPRSRSCSANSRRSTNRANFQQVPDQADLPRARTPSCRTAPAARARKCTRSSGTR